MSGKADPDIGNIILPSKVNISDELKVNYNPLFLSQFINHLRRKTPKRIYKTIWSKEKTINHHFTHYHASTKKGPTGLPALYASLLDVKNLTTSLKESISVIGGPDFEEQFMLVSNNLDNLSEVTKQPIDGKTSFRKLSYFPDKEGKTRVIAIGDY